MPLRNLLQRLGFIRRSRTLSRRESAQQLIATGSLAEKSGQLKEALSYYQEAAALDPGLASAHVNCGIVFESTGRPTEALEAYAAALRAEPGHPYASYNAGKLHFIKGNFGQAEALLRSALAAKPDFPEALVVLAGVLESTGRLEDTQGPLESALKLRPDYAGALRNYALLLERLERPGDAEAAWRRLCSLAPVDAEACCRVGRLLAKRGATDEAYGWFDRARGIDPGSAAPLLEMGNLLATAGRLAEAETHYRQAIALDPRSADAHVNLGNVLKDQGMQLEALARYDAAIALAPSAPEPRWARLMGWLPGIRGPDDDLAQVRKRFGEELGALEKWFDDEQRAARGHAAVGVAQPFWIAYQEENNRELLARYGALCTRLMALWGDAQRRGQGRPRPAGPIRVGVVTQFFRNHSVWNALVRGWFDKLDPARFALHAFCLGGAEDEETRFARARAASFVRDAGDLRQWVESILAVQPDVLIYPEIGMDPMTLKLASLRLAPVQAATWGHPETTGLPTIDFYLTADDLEPPGAQSHYTERLVSLPHLGCHFQPEPVAPSEVDLDALGLDGAAPILVCPGTPFKYAPEHDRLLVEIARRLGRCRFAFFQYRIAALSSALRDRLARAFAQGGLDFEAHVRFIPWQSRGDFLGLLRRATVFLDTIGFSGFNTALQAVASDLPIVTREGRFLRGRLASGILRRMGMGDLVAAGDDDYVELAVRLSTDKAFRAQFQHRIAAGRGALYSDLAAIKALERFLADAVKPS